MRRDCITCEKPTIRGREIDGNIRVVDALPKLLGDAVLLGDLDDDPLVLWGVSRAGETLPGGRVIPPAAPRYRAHRCAREPEVLQAAQCPECNYDGPHLVLDEDGAELIVECGKSACSAEFSVPAEALP